MNRLTGKIVLEIRSFLDHESFYRWILACHVVTRDMFKLEVPEGENALLVKSGRLMIQSWLSLYFDFPIANIHFGGTQGYKQLSKTGGFLSNPKGLDKTPNVDQGAVKEQPGGVGIWEVSIPGPNYFLDFMINHHAEELLSRESPSGKGTNWFQAVCRDSRVWTYRDNSNTWFDLQLRQYSYWAKLRFVTEKIFTDALIHSDHYREIDLRQYPLLAAIQKQGCLEFPPHDKMFSIQSVLYPTCLEHDYQSDRMTSFAVKFTPRYLANSVTVLDMLTNQNPRWEFEIFGSRPVLRWSFSGEEDNNDDVEYVDIPWCGSSETFNETRSEWKMLQRHISRCIDDLEEFIDEEEFTEDIVSKLVCDYQLDDLGCDFEMDDSLDHDGEALMAHLEAQQNKLEMWEENEGMRPEAINQQVEKIKTLAREGLAQWKEYFEGPQEEASQSEKEEQDFATWESIGLSDRRCLRFDPVQFHDWMCKEINNGSIAGFSPSATSLLQFPAEDLGMGLTWRIEGANGELAVVLLGPHGSIWVQQEDKTIVEPFCCSDDDESYTSEDSSLACIQQDDPAGEESTDEPGGMDTTNVNNLAETFLERIEAMESTFKTEVANLKSTNANLTAEINQVKTTNSSLKRDLAEMKSTDQNQDCEIQILKADLHQTRLELAKARQQLATQQLATQGHST